MASILSTSGPLSDSTGIGKPIKIRKRTRVESGGDQSSRMLLSTVSENPFELCGSSTQGCAAY